MGDTDALELGQRIVQVVEVGRKVSTYKLATLVALVDTCVQSSGAAPGRPLRVGVDGLAERVIDLYWPQVRPYADASALRQNTQGGRGIPEMVADLRRTAGARGAAAPARLAELDDPTYRTVRKAVALRLAQMPLKHLQNLPGGAEPFLYDEPWLAAPSVTAGALDAHGRAVTLLPGVAWHLARLSGLLRPVLQSAWESFVVGLNPMLEESDVSGFLFGADRSALAHAAQDLVALQAGRCFYCSARLSPGGVHVDHVLPWSRIPLDGTANLVAADVRCNLAKRDALPVVEHHLRALARPRDALAAVGGGRLPLLLDRTRQAGVALFTSSPRGTPLWEAPGVYRSV